MKLETKRELSTAAVIIYGSLVMVVKKVWPEDYSPVFWVVPAFFYIYEVVFLWLLERSKNMTPEKILTSSMIMRGVKFLGVAAIMLIYVKLGLEGKKLFLLYTLIFYIITSLCETWLVGAANKEREKKE